MILATPPLRARLWDHLHATERLIARALSGASPEEPIDLRDQVVAAACVAALSTGILVWAEQGSKSELPELLDQSLSLVREELG